MHDFVQLGVFIAELLSDKNREHFLKLCAGARNKNGWFDEKYIRFALHHWMQLLQEQELVKLVPQKEVANPRNVLIIGAGNIPMAAFHDILCVLLSGHHAWIKYSSEDEVLIPFLIEELCRINPQRKHQIVRIDQPLGKNLPHAVIASGSDASEKIFLEYFSHLPHLIRKSRTGAAVLTGNESPEELRNLGTDIFTYHGLGCRNVTFLLVPEQYPVLTLREHWTDFSDCIYNKKYANNYDYYKALFALNKTPFEDGGFFLIREDTHTLFAPPSVIHYSFYKVPEEVDLFLKDHQEKIQVVVGKNRDCDFGFAQRPVINAFADGKNTMEFLVTL